MKRKRHIVALGICAPLILASGTTFSDTSAPSTPAPLTSLAAFDNGISGETSATPTTAEWRDAPEVAPTRRGPRAAACKTYRVREWVRVACSDLVTSAIATLGGTVVGNAFWIDPQTDGKDGKLPSGGEVLFPIRRGDKRVIQILTFGPGYEGPLTQLPAIVVQEHWLDDEERPVLTIL